MNKSGQIYAKVEGESDEIAAESESEDIVALHFHIDPENGQIYAHMESTESETESVSEESESQSED